MFFSSSFAFLNFARWSDDIKPIMWSVCSFVCHATPVGSFSIRLANEGIGPFGIGRFHQTQRSCSRSGKRLNVDLSDFVCHGSEASANTTCEGRVTLSCTPTTKSLDLECGKNLT